MGLIHGVVSGAHWAISVKMADGLEYLERLYKEESEDTDWDEEEGTVIPVKTEDMFEYGGENMPDREYDHQRRTLAGVVERHSEKVDDLEETVDAIVAEVGTVQEAAELAKDYKRNAIDDHRSFQSYLTTQGFQIDETSQNLEYVSDVLDDVANELDGMGSPSDASAQALDDATGYDGR